MAAILLVSRPTVTNLGARVRGPAQLRGGCRARRQMGPREGVRVCAMRRDGCATSKGILPAEGSGINAADLPCRGRRIPTANRPTASGRCVRFGTVSATSGALLCVVLLASCSSPSAGVTLVRLALDFRCQSARIADPDNPRRRYFRHWDGLARGLSIGTSSRLAVKPHSMDRRRVRQKD
jgi:hypothetical protein